MPARRTTHREALYQYPWIESFWDKDLCLYEVLVQAVIARNTAANQGGDPRVIAVGDRILGQIKDERVAGEKACNKATAAIRKYDEAYMAAYRARHNGAKRRTRRRTH